MSRKRLKRHVNIFLYFLLASIAIPCMQVMYKLPCEDVLVAVVIVDPEHNYCHCVPYPKPHV